MEHITIVELGNEMVRLIPDHGYRLYNIRSNKYYSEAVVKESEKKYFRAEEA